VITSLQAVLLHKNKANQESPPEQSQIIRDDHLAWPGRGQGDPGNPAKNKIRRAPQAVQRARRSTPEHFIGARTAKKPMVAAYLKANREGKLDPESGRNTRTISGEGHGLAMAGLSHLPRAHIPATVVSIILGEFLKEGQIQANLPDWLGPPVYSIFKEIKARSL